MLALNKVSTLMDDSLIFYINIGCFRFQTSLFIGTKRILVEFLLPVQQNEGWNSNP